MDSSHTAPAFSQAPLGHPQAVQMAYDGTGTAAWAGEVVQRDGETGSRWITSGPSTAYEGSAGASSASQSPQIAIAVSGTAPGAYQPWVNPTFLDPTLSQPSPPLTANAVHPNPPPPQGRHSVSFGSHPMWDVTLHGPAFWSNGPPSSTDSWTPTATTTPGELPAQRTLSAPSGELLALPPRPLPAQDYSAPYASLAPPPPPSSTYHAYHAPGPPSYHPSGLVRGSTASWGNGATSSTSWAGPGHPPSTLSSYDPIPPLPPPHNLIPRHSTGWSAAANQLPVSGVPAESASADFSPVTLEEATVAAMTSKGKGRPHRASRSGALGAASASSPSANGSLSSMETTTSSRSKGKGTAAKAVAAAAAAMDDGDDFYALPPGAEATVDGKLRKPRRKRRKMGEPPRDLAQRKYVCELCVDQPKSFARPSALKIHMLTHTKEKPHNCPICFRSFAIVSNLKRHQKLHEDEKSTLWTTTAGGPSHPAVKREMEEGGSGVQG